jgi:hypothetical protein
MTVRRIKTYTGQTGYVYQYYFVGKRPALDGDAEAPSTEFIFDVTSDRKTTFAVSIFLRPEAVDAWAASRGRALSEPEQYAGVKLRLMQAFDEIPDMLNSGRRLRLEPDTLLTLLETIGVE